MVGFTHPTPAAIRPRRVTPSCCPKYLPPEAPKLMTLRHLITQTDILLAPGGYRNGEGRGAGGGGKGESQ